MDGPLCVYIDLKISLNLYLDIYLKNVYVKYHMHEQIVGFKKSVALKEGCQCRAFHAIVKGCENDSRITNANTLFDTTKNRSGMRESRLPSDTEGFDLTLLHPVPVSPTPQNIN